MKVCINIRKFKNGLPHYDEWPNPVVVDCKYFLMATMGIFCNDLCLCLSSLSIVKQVES